MSGEFTLDYSVYVLTKKENLIFCLGFSLVVMALGLLFFNHLLFSSVFLLLLLPGRRIWCKYLAEKRKKTLLLQFRDLLYSLSASVATGRQMAEGLKEALPVISKLYGLESVLSREVNYMVKKIFDAGENDEYVLKEFAARTGIKEIVNFADIYSISKKTGADLQRVIRKTVELLLDRIETEREMKAMTSQKRLEFGILTAMPPGALVFLRLSSPYYLESMYQSLAGRIIMAFALIALLSAAYMSYVMTKTV